MELIQHPDGVYLGLNHQRYLNDTALGSGAIKLLSYSPVEWFDQSPYNPFCAPPNAEEAKHYRVGSATHAATLEGLKTYEEVFGVQPTLETHPDALESVRDLQAELARYHAPTGGVKAELIRRLALTPSKRPVLDTLVEQFRMSGKRLILPAEDRRVRILQRLAMASPEEFQLKTGEMTTLRGAFTGGLSEVSVFWTDEWDIRHRVRFDKLKPRLHGDVKTLAGWKTDIEPTLTMDAFTRSLLREAKQRRYPLQAACYEAGYPHLVRLVDEGKVFGGTPAERAMLEEICASQVWTWMWMFMLTTGAPRVKGVLYDLDGPRHAKNLSDREDAIAQFFRYREMFGLGEGALWFDPHAVVHPDEDDWGMA